MATDPSYRRKGVGRALINAGERWLRDRQIPKVQLMVREANAAVAPFYEQLGSRRLRASSWRSG
ncbi:GNAT family N-acetyltransferase [Sphingomonas nostoxanthinifaciens]|uniref:GNAT family N-acetyltransferase n=1 Tax=Sphingomonas nostoxanthinifaciens TaxID=2872652 RepID=UPI001CC1ED6D|nr:GNAT family N-acetyltransferase [Sphingomonas nostoxanthinifaciens]